MLDEGKGKAETNFTFPVWPLGWIPQVCERRNTGTVLVRGRGAVPELNSAQHLNVHTLLNTNMCLLTCKIHPY